MSFAELLKKLTEASKTRAINGWPSYITLTAALTSEAQSGFAPLKRNAVDGIAPGYKRAVPILAALHKTIESSVSSRVPPAPPVPFCAGAFMPQNTGLLTSNATRLKNVSVVLRPSRTRTSRRAQTAGTTPTPGRSCTPRDRSSSS